MPNRKIAYRGSFLTVTRKDVTLPNGRCVTAEVIEHPGAVLIVPFLSACRVVLLRQFRPAIGAWLYEFPAGTIEAGEKPAACARREIIEETGYRAGKMRKLGIIYPVPGYSTEKISLYAAERLTYVGMHCEDDEVIEPLVFNKGDIRSMLAKGKLIDAKSICALSMAGWL